MIEIEIKAKITNPKLAFEKIKKIGGEYSHTENSGSCDGQGGLACCTSWGCKESDMTE